MAMVFEIEHLSKSFAGMPVLKDISLQVQKGEVVSLIGPSGSGKSTLLRCAALLEKMDAGTLRYHDIEVCKNGIYAPRAVQQQARRCFGMVFQNYNLFPHFSVLKNITDAPIRVFGRPREEVFAEAREWLDRIALSDRGNAYPGQLSGGQQQRVAIARALALKPEILFFDEPTSALDPEMTGEILKIIRTLAEKRMTMVIVTHEIDFAEQVSDRIVFMENGMVIESGPAKEIVASPKCARTRAFLNGMKKRI